MLDFDGVYYLMQDIRELQNYKEMQEVTFTIKKIIPVDVLLREFWLVSKEEPLKTVKYWNQILKM